MALIYLLAYLVQYFNSLRPPKLVAAFGHLLAAYVYAMVFFVLPGVAVVLPLLLLSCCLNLRSVIGLLSATLPASIFLVCNLFLGFCWYILGENPNCRRRERNWLLLSFRASMLLFPYVIAFLLDYGAEPQPFGIKLVVFAFETLLWIPTAYVAGWSTLNWWVPFGDAPD